ncbi:unnamed protein product, partial [Prunus brigantina]
MGYSIRQALFISMPILMPIMWGISMIVAPLVPIAFISILTSSLGAQRSNCLSPDTVLSPSTASLPPLSPLCLGYMLCFLIFIFEFLVLSFGVIILVLSLSLSLSLSLESNLVLFHTRTCYVEVDYHSVCEKVAVNELLVAYCFTADQIADIFTKGLSPAPFFFLLQSKLPVLPRLVNLRECNEMQS